MYLKFGNVANDLSVKFVRWWLCNFFIQNLHSLTVINIFVNCIFVFLKHTKSLIIKLEEVAEL